jgi:hypothetical protein
MGVGLGHVKDPRNLVPTVLGHRDRVCTNLTGGDGSDGQAKTYISLQYRLSFPCNFR